MVKLTTKNAVLTVLRDYDKTPYWLSKQLGKAPIMISNYIREEKSCKMSKKTAKKFTKLFDIEISDIYNPTKLPEIHNE